MSRQCPKHPAARAVQIAFAAHRAFGDNLAVLVKNQLLDCMDFPIGHDENSFWLKYLIAPFYLAKIQRSIYHISKLGKVRRLVAIIKVLYV